MAVYEAPFLAGDFNDDGRVDAADYTVWRDALGQPVTLPGDASPGVVDASDYAAWRSNYGATLSAPTAGSIAAPEPTALLCLVAAGACCGASFRRVRC